MKSILITVWECCDCKSIFRTTENDDGILCTKCSSTNFIPIDEYYEKPITGTRGLKYLNNSMSFPVFIYWTMRWHLHLWTLTGYNKFRPSADLLSQILTYFCVKYQKYAEWSYWYEILSNVEYTLRTGRAWWLPKWYTQCFSGKDHLWYKSGNTDICYNCGAERYR